MPHALMHTKSIFLGACIITKVAFQRHVLQLFVIYIGVRSQSTNFGKYILASVIFLLSLVLCQSILYGSCVSLLEHFYSHSSHGTPHFLMDFYDFQAYVVAIFSF
jgi:hypothetical protein